MGIPKAHAIDDVSADGGALRKHEQTGNCSRCGVRLPWYSTVDTDTDHRGKARGGDHTAPLAILGSVLTPEEIAALRREAKDTSAYCRKAFAHLGPKFNPLAAGR